MTKVRQLPLSVHQICPRRSLFPSAVLPNNGGTGGNPANAPIIFETFHASTQAPVSAQPPITPATLDDKIAREGIPSVAVVAARYHSAKNLRDPPTTDEFLGRVFNAQVSLVDRNFGHHQYLPNAVALRLLAPRAGPSYAFEENKT